MKWYAFILVLLIASFAWAAPRYGGFPPTEPDPGASAQGLRVFMVGDSITATSGTGSTFHYPEMSRAYVQNEGISGTTTVSWSVGGEFGLTSGIGDFEADIEGGNFDAVHIMLGVNDANNLGPLSKASYKANLESIISQIQAFSPTVSWIVLSKCGYGTSTYDSDIDGYADAVDEIAAADSGVYVGFDLRLLERDSFYFDTFHPNLAGHQILKDWFEYYIIGR